MKKLLLPLLLTACSLTVQAQTLSQELTKAYQQSAFDLFNTLLLEQTDNVCFSPLSVQMALSMAQNGAGGNTLKQLQHALGTQGFSNEEIGQFNSQLTQQLTTRPPYNPEALAWMDVENPKEIYDGWYPLCELANSLWTRPNVQLYDDFVQALRTSYEAGVDTVWFDTWEGIGKINAWANEKTHGLIPYIYQQPQSSELAVVLANALYFKGSWLYEFNSEDTSQQPFLLDDESYVDVNMMFIREEFQMGVTPSFYAVTLQYGVMGDFSMTLFIPQEGTALAPLTFEDWSAAMQGRHQPMNLYVPRFQIEGNYDLEDVMKKLGVTDAFDNELADFTKMCEVNRSINRIFQLSKILVDEKGTEAAAITVIDYAEGMIPDPDNYIDFRVDRPFYFTIQNRDTGAILFTGRVTQFDGVRSKLQDGLANTKAARCSSPCYDLQGRQLPAPPQKGFYVQDGKLQFRN
ncbi:MAG: serpin family protein [Bacteroidaceae bacterium]|nr:serpin family protein [Bacteroidaceae bacterium]